MLRCAVYSIYVKLKEARATYTTEAGDEKAGGEAESKRVGFSFESGLAFRRVRSALSSRDPREPTLVIIYTLVHAFTFIYSLSIVCIKIHLSIFLLNIIFINKITFSLSYK